MDRLIAWGTAMMMGAVLGGCEQPSSPTLTIAPTLTPYAGPFYVTLRVEPVMVGDLGDRVLGPATIFVEAPTAQWVEVYLQPMDMPYEGKPLADPMLIGADNDPADGFAVTWRADKPYLYVELYAIAYLQLDVDYSRTSQRVTILLDWRGLVTPSP